MQLSIAMRSFHLRSDSSRTLIMCQNVLYPDKIVYKRPECTSCYPVCSIRKSIYHLLTCHSYRVETWAKYCCYSGLLEKASDQTSTCRNFVFMLVSLTKLFPYYLCFEMQERLVSCKQYRKFSTWKSQNCAKCCFVVQNLLSLERMSQHGCFHIVIIQR